MRILLTAPFVGEIGWELLAWQGIVRRTLRHGRFDRLVVLGTPGRAGFYLDMPLDYRDIDLSMVPGVPYEDRRFSADSIIGPDAIRAVVAEMVEPVAQHYQRQGCEIGELWPSYDGRFQPTDERHQCFIRFERDAVRPLPAPSVLLVPRTRSLGAHRNWPPAAWQELRKLLERRGIHTLEYPCDARTAIERLSACDLAVGQSTGGMHLAGLCGCPRVVWGSEDYLWTRFEFTNRQRYETVWNPLAAPTFYHEVKGWPEPREVSEWVAHGLRRIGRRTGAGTRRAAFRLRWRAQRFIADQIMRGSILRQAPWPVQRWVRYGLM